MKPLTREWADKAEADFISAQREFRARKKPNYDATCFFAQQSNEKYIKARLQEADIEFGKTHGLVKLLDWVAQVEPLWEPYRPTFRPISAYAVAFRQDSESADKEEAAEALKICREFRKIARIAWGYQNNPTKKNYPQMNKIILVLADALRYDVARDNMGFLGHLVESKQASLYKMTLWPERDLEVIHSRLNDPDFARLWAAGQSMTVHEAVALALQE